MIISLFPYLTFIESEKSQDSEQHNSPDYCDTLATLLWCDDRNFEFSFFSFS